MYMHLYSCTFCRVDYNLDMVNGPIPIHISMGGMVWGQGNAAQGATLIQVENINTLRREGEGRKEEEGERWDGGREGGKEERRKK